ncbi:helix-turn-helix transcriptional regulator [Ramlibacter sp. MMS24-I3-19]|uniref:helix-turn-helix transcriptional regulator n=1 Tax=Ramlibacter sp. MMS24-I3-19 TaxID=3416606 RepID=UPI003CFF7B32
MQDVYGDSQLLRLPEVLKVLRIGRTAFYEGIKLGIYPKPIRMGKRTAVWLHGELKDVIKQAIAERSGSTRGEYAP